MSSDEANEAAPAKKRRPPSSSVLPDLHSGVSKAPNLKGVKSNSFVCNIGSCTREYFSPQGLRYHMQHHHGSSERAIANGGTDMIKLPPPVKLSRRPPTKASTLPLPSGAHAQAAAPSSLTNFSPNTTAAGASAPRGSGHGSVPSKSVSHAGAGNAAESSGVTRTADTLEFVSRAYKHKHGSGPGVEGGVLGGAQTIDSSGGEQIRKRGIDVEADGEAPTTGATVGKKARILSKSSGGNSARRKPYPGGASIPGYNDAISAIPLVSETEPLLQAQRIQLSSLFEQHTGGAIGQESSTVLNRLVSLQRHTHSVVEEIVDLVARRDSLRTEIQNLEQATPGHLLNPSRVAAIDAASQVRSVLLLVLNSFRPIDTPALHPLELDAVAEALDSRSRDLSNTGKLGVSLIKEAFEDGLALTRD